MASVKPRPRVDGTTAWRLHYRHDGHQPTITFDDPASADHWRQVFNTLGPGRGLALLRAENNAAADVPTVRAAFDRHITILTGITEGTRADYRREAARDILPSLGDYPITVMDEDAVAAWVNHLEAKPLSGKTIANRHGLLSAVLERATRDGYLDRNPCKGMRLPDTSHLTEEMVFLTPAEFGTLLGVLPHRWHPLVVFLVGTGCRWSEATALQVGDVHLDAAEPHAYIRRAWKHVRNGPMRLGPPKSKRSRRKIAIPPEAAELLRPLLAARTVRSLVFTSPRGAVVRNGTFHGRVWQPALRRLEAAGFAKTPRIHDLRHTYASWTLGAGAPIMAVQRQMGHESIQTTVDRYGHLGPAGLDLAAAAASAALSAALALTG